jgi:YesN/AraC family two-component response regulator
MTIEERQELFAGIRYDDGSTAPILVVFISATVTLFIQIIIYGIKMFKRLYGHDKNIEKVYSFKENLSLKWLKIFISLYVVYYIYEFYMVAFKGIDLNNSSHYAMVSLHIFFVGLMAYKQKEIFLKNSYKKTAVISGINDNNQNEKVYHEEEEEGSIINVKENTISQFVSEDKKTEILNKLDVLMEKDKIYLDQNLNLYDLSKKLKINKTYLSYIINEGTESNFYNYVNKYRIESAKKMLIDSKFDHLSIEGIANNAGFKNRSSFYPVFKKFVGETPTEFKKKNQLAN